MLYEVRVSLFRPSGKKAIEDNIFIASVKVRKKAYTRKFKSVLSMR